MKEFLDKVFSLSVWEVLSDVHGGLAMLSLILFGAAFVLVTKQQIKRSTRWLKFVLLGLWVDLILLDAFGLYIYVPYRAKGGPRTALLASEETSWLHKLIFEHKEFLAFAPPALLLVATVLVWRYKGALGEQTLLRRTVLASLVLALVFVLVVATEAVLVTKAAPLQ